MGGQISVFLYVCLHLGLGLSYQPHWHIRQLALSNKMSLQHNHIFVKNTYNVFRQIRAVLDVTRIDDIPTSAISTRFQVYFQSYK